MKPLNRFNWIAQRYDLLVKIVFAEKLHEAQVYFLKHVGHTDQVLILGGGSGKFLESLLKARPGTHIIYIEASSEMISIARQRTGGASNVTFIHGTEQDIPSETKFDVAITNFFLDVFSNQEVSEVSREICNHLKPSAKWLVTDFVDSPKWKHKFLLKLMYWFFSITGSINVNKLPPWRAIMTNCGVTIAEEKYFADGFVCSVVARNSSAA